MRYCWMNSNILSRRILLADELYTFYAANYYHSPVRLFLWDQNLQSISLLFSKCLNEKYCFTRRFFLKMFEFVTWVSFMFTFQNNHDFLHTRKINFSVIVNQKTITESMA